MTQQEINDYFSGAGYTPNGDNTWVDATGQFTFVAGPDQLSMSYPGPPEYDSVIRNQFLITVDMLEAFIVNSEDAALNPPGI
jgi:hypothetical protein